jgi:nucleoside-diphosphate-sugar epimerase
MKYNNVMQSAAALPDEIQDDQLLEDTLSTPTSGVIEVLSRLDGDVMILGVAGKMGPSLAAMVKRASDSAGVRRRVIGVSRFGSPSDEQDLQSQGIDTVRADLLDTDQLERLPDAPNIIYMAGMKFGSSGQESLTWAMNTFLPGMVCRKFSHSRIAAFSTGNVYGLTPVHGGGSVETDDLNPMGDYAMSCVGRERIFEHFSRSMNIPVSILRLNYAIDLRYGVLADLARRVWAGEAIDVSMGHVNVIWQADANAMAIQSLAHASSPPFILNIAGPELLSVRQVCEKLGAIMNKPPRLVGEESPTALLNNGEKGHRLFGRPRVGIETLIRWTADWVMRGGSSLNKPTHFETRDGKF